MTTKLTAQDSVNGLERVFTLRVNKAEWAAAKFDNFDLALIQDIEHGRPSETPLADELLGLETVVRRIEESAK